MYRHTASIKISIFRKFSTFTHTYDGFNFVLLKCRRDGKPLYPYYKIYSKRKCKQCEGKVTITRLGDDSERVTYYCDNCQTNDLKKFARYSFHFATLSDQYCLSLTRIFNP